MTSIQMWIDFSEHFAPILPELFGNKVQIRTIDPELTIRHIMDLDSEIPVTFHIGSRLPANSGPEIAMRDKKPVRRFIDKSHYGFELRTLNIPFEDESGCISLTYNVELQYRIAETMERIAAATQEITASSEQISNNSETMSRRFGEMMARMDRVFEYSYAMRDIAGIVHSINDHLKLISINALIEAAHAGDRGKGFAVVAQEVRKLTDSTYEQVTEVKQTINRMLADIEQAKASVAGIRGDIRQQTTASGDIYEAIHGVTMSITQLKDTLDELLNIK